MSKGFLLMNQGHNQNCEENKRASLSFGNNWFSTLTEVSLEV